LTEILRQAQVGAGSTRQPFAFFITAAALYLLALYGLGLGFPARGSRRHARRSAG
jgi:octopine/nopaline transport system permease protein